MAEKSTDSSPSEATSSRDEKASGNWWDTWISSAKSKSAEVYTMVKKDLDEIGSAVKSEASHVFSSTSTVIGKTLKLENPESPANVMKKSLSTFIALLYNNLEWEKINTGFNVSLNGKEEILYPWRKQKKHGQVSTVLNPEPDDEDDTEVILSSGDTTMLSTYKKELEALQRVDATFIVPAYSPEFDAWRASLDTAAEDAVISPATAGKRLACSPLLKAQYARLVPDAVSHNDFWERYLFRVALLQDRLAAASRKQPTEEPPTSDPVMAHLPRSHPSPIQQSPKKVLTGLEETEKPCASPDIDNAVAWDDVLSENQPDLNFAEDFANDVELTEEQQILLLEEYEKEISTKKQTKAQTKTQAKTTRDVANNNTKQTNTTSNSKTKAAQTRDKMNNKQTITDKTVKNKNGGQKSPKKTAKDVCGNNLVEDYFAEKDETNEDANSDESWEKEFEIEDVKA